MNVLGLMAKHPRPGFTKSRLAESVGAETAARLSAAFTEDLMQRLSSLAERFIVAATPEHPDAAAWFRSRMTNESELWFQPDGSLGERIAWFFGRAEPGHDCRCVLVGSDSPDLPSSVIRNAFATLAVSDLVVAPACDGGFVLLGLRVTADGLLTDVRWSSATTLNDLLQAAVRRNVAISVLPTWYDVDDLSGLMTLSASLHPAVTRAADRAECPRTTSVLAEWAGAQQPLGIA